MSPGPFLLLLRNIDYAMCLDDVANTWCYNFALTNLCCLRKVSIFNINTFVFLIDYFIPAQGVAASTVDAGWFLANRRLLCWLDQIWSINKFWLDILTGWGSSSTDDGSDLSYLRIQSNDACVRWDLHRIVNCKIVWGAYVIFINVILGGGCYDTFFNLNLITLTNIKHRSVQIWIRPICLVLHRLVYIIHLNFKVVSLLCIST